ncbi:class I adenylate cyclase [Pantoea sp. SoEX]|uniref:class I adenylate cyclase n=1 Tax=Pantoea sp. SoEX TaxID=2576763 RepID=UPI001357BD06|nr:class I adenylate cyclase [Pantoea sp. SoEX]MXP51411.1 hypothetical protein [Pantoea sp. SoEX]
MKNDFSIYNILTVKKRLDAIYELRVNRALSNMHFDLRKIYHLIPIFLHYQHPLIPGYTEGKVPYGISSFVPDKNQYKLLINLIGNSKKLNIPKDEMPITGIYSMGSTSSICQNNNSDLDIWVFYKSWLNNQEVEHLKIKCMALKNWCNLIGVKINFFLIDENALQYKKINDFSKKNFNCINNIFLLDEFYRTSFRIAGKRILWPIIPYNEKYQYEEYIILLYKKGILIRDEWFDLGDFSSLKIEEYLHIILLNIHKSISSPYKSLLKTLLIEAYSIEYPNTKLLSLDVKECLHKGEIICFGLDPYCMMLNRITNYLIATKDNIRLYLVRCCFYYKVSEKLTSKKNNDSINWRRKILIRLVKYWGWNEKELKQLDNNINKKSNIIYEIHNELLNTIKIIHNHFIKFNNKIKK